MTRLALLLVLLIVGALLLGAAANERRISIYAATANYTLPVIDRGGRDYVGLRELLQPLGTISTRIAGNRLKLFYNDAECEFVAGKKRIRIRGKDFDLPANFLLENGQGLVPLSSLSTLLPRLLGSTVAFNENARRLFIGNVAVHFTAQVSKTNPPQLVMNFTSPVNPMIATEPGKLRMVFNQEAVAAPGSQVLTFESSEIPSATFQENNGAAELIVNGSVPLMATFSNNGRTITVAPPAAQAISAPTLSPPPLPAPAAAQVPAASIRYFAVVDASHGGDERGAALSDVLAEKDVTLSLAHTLRQELMARGLQTLLVRDSDVPLTADQRATIANSADAQIYISLHATSEGRGVHLYTALLPPAAESRGPFLDWNTAQGQFLPRGQIAEDAIADALRKKGIAVRSLPAALRPLNNVATAALAVEVAPSSGDVSQLNTPSYQQLIAASIASGVADVQEKLQGGPK